MMLGTAGSGRRGPEEARIDFRRFAGIAIDTSEHFSVSIFLFSFGWYFSSENCEENDSVSTFSAYVAVILAVYGLPDFSWLLLKFPRVNS